MLLLLVLQCTIRNLSKIDERQSALLSIIAPRPFLSSFWLGYSIKVIINNSSNNDNDNNVINNVMNNFYSTYNIKEYSKALNNIHELHNNPKLLL